MVFDIGDMNINGAFNSNAWLYILLLMLLP